MQRYLIVLEYIGTLYSGSQKQPKNMPDCSKPVITIQDELEKAISTLTKTKTRTIFSGRTDAGVHAKGQTAHFDSELELNPCKFINSLNGILPNTISVKELRKVPKTFHAQKSARARYYRYTIANRLQRSAWDANCLLVRYPLDIERINKALNYLKGRHDFTSFKKVRTSNPAKICNMYEAKASKNGDYVYIDFIADRFLYNMIRIIVGTVLLMERKSLPPETLKEILELKDNTKAGSTVSPEGLTLINVIYNDINMETAYENLFS
ncbi:MAG: tRNA pseudouridine(38-40) synthase TruA [Candidatus Gastranaerophilales bacterium]|nr:tRNA pseudouridine(38-40) synthase TruA [Candidatus Gastranaerophilales bacterium]